MKERALASPDHSQTASDRARRRRRLFTRKEGIAYSFLLPFGILFILFSLYPFIAGLLLSFTDNSPLAKETHFVGLDNYIKILFNDRVFMSSLRNTVYYSILLVPAQVLLGLCGIVVTTTGFSGRLIAGTSRPAQWLIVLGVVLVLTAAALVVVGVLHLWWLTQHPGKSTRDWLGHALGYRDRKTRFYRFAIVLMLAGLVFYVAAIALMLLNPASAAISR